MFSPLPELLELKELLELPEDFLDLMGQQRIAPFRPITLTFDHCCADLKHYLIPAIQLRLLNRLAIFWAPAAPSPIRNLLKRAR